MDVTSFFAGSVIYPASFFPILKKQQKSPQHVDTELFQL